MGRWIAIAFATAALCWGVYHLAPSTSGRAFTIHGWDITWMALIGIVGAYSFHRMTAKR